MISLKLKREVNILKINLNSEQEIDFGPSILNISQQYNNKSETIYVNEISIEKDLGKYHLKVVFPTISSDRSSYNRKDTVNYDDALLLIREK